ncbi:MAG TPA: N-acetyltransferase [Acholeplasmataceae bacterium]|jgi:predicted GNAT family acetyltransferase|nr:N-acetyltransferase [Acholeplasmataceae bacterium]
MMRYEYNKDYIYLYDGDLKIGEILFPVFKDNLRVINRTYIDPNYRSAGLASNLVEEAYKYLKKNNCKTVVTCPYVTKWFERFPEKQDVIDLKEQDSLYPFCEMTI